MAHLGHERRPGRDHTGNGLQRRSLHEPQAGLRNAVSREPDALLGQELAMNPRLVRRAEYRHRHVALVRVYRGLGHVHDGPPLGRADSAGQRDEVVATPEPDQERGPMRSGRLNLILEEAEALQLCNRLGKDPHGQISVLGIGGLEQLLQLVALAVLLPDGELDDVAEVDLGLDAGLLPRGRCCTRQWRR